MVKILVVLQLLLVSLVQSRVYHTLWIRPSELFSINCGEHGVYWSASEMMAGPAKPGAPIDCGNVAVVGMNDTAPCPEERSVSCCMKSALVVYPGKKNLRLVCYNEKDVATMEVSARISQNLVCPTVSECSQLNYSTPECDCKPKDLCTSGPAYRQEYIPFAMALVGLQVLVYCCFFYRNKVMIPRLPDTEVVNGAHVYSPEDIQKEAFVDILNKTAYQE